MLWTEAIAVGAQEFAERMSRQIPHRMQITIETTTPTGDNWIAKESGMVYGTENAAKNRSISSPRASSQCNTWEMKRATR
jgi:hypothetical protein